ncbi:arylsulfatase I-like isoform X1 [Ylistrum balloti]|uniref:arylsulfatase I-like isoform X1 n=2 Tax=Ylistrum balloti TaxID=509963 RepID=UPI0029058785|nr:arylsulfatase I-like isoform X1 [Ylistrum balloti]
MTSILWNRECLVTFLVILTFVKAKSSRPHIIVIVADDLGWNDISFHGSNQIPTPNIDSLAHSGIILNNYYVSPICTPTRGALMSGRHPIHTGLQESVIVGAQPYGLPLNFTIMPQWLQKLGYRTHMVGKWHLGFFKSEYTPTRRGFESYTGYYQGCGDYYDHTYEADEAFFGYDFRRNESLDYSAIGQYSTTVFTNRAVDIINQHNSEEPLFLYLPYQAVHSGNLPSGNNLQAPSSYINRHPHIQNKERKNFAGMVAALDDGVDSVVQALKKNGLYENSILMFTTDNGGPANGFDGNAASNFPLRGLKATLWEGGVRGVGFLHSPLLKKSGYVSEQLLHVCDWLPTFYSAAGGNPGDLGETDGYDMWTMLSSNSKPVRKELLHNISPSKRSGAIRVGEYKLLVGGVNMKWDGWYPPYQVTEDSSRLYYDNPAAKNSLFKELTGTSDNRITAVMKNITLVSAVKVNCGPKPANASTNCDPRQNACLYHIPSDPCEYNNIAASNPSIVSALTDRLDYYLSTMVPPANKPVDPKGNPILNNGAWISWQD